MAALLNAGDTKAVSAEGRKCELHRYHSPKPLYFELHHVLPRAWQKAWKPAGEKRELWAPGTAVLCRTGHGNVHMLLVALMFELRVDLDIKAATTRASQGRRRHQAELELALQAITRFTGAGGDLGFLFAHELWGGI